MSTQLVRLKPWSNKYQSKRMMTCHPAQTYGCRNSATTALCPRPPRDTTDPEVGPTRDPVVVEREFVVTKAVDTRHSMYPLRAVDRVCDIIDLLAKHPTGMTLSTLASAVMLPKSSAFRYLAALETHGYVIRSDDGIGYRLGTPLAGVPPVRERPIGATAAGRQAADVQADQRRCPGEPAGHPGRQRHPLPVGLQPAADGRPGSQRRRSGDAARQRRRQGRRGAARG